MTPLPARVALPLTVPAPASVPVVVTLTVTVAPTVPLRFSVPLVVRMPVLLGAVGPVMVPESDMVPELLMTAVVRTVPVAAGTDPAIEMVPETFRVPELLIWAAPLVAAVVDMRIEPATLIVA